MYVTQERSLTKPGSIAVSGPIYGWPMTGLGDISQGSSFAGISLSNWVLIGGAVALGIWWFRRDSESSLAVPRRRRRRHNISPLTTAVYAAGSAAGGYLLGKYTNVSF
ncbi:MAG: hypothetical protein ACREMY_08240 [bacterium]